MCLTGAGLPSSYTSGEIIDLVVGIPAGLDKVLLLVWIVGSHYDDAVRTAFAIILGQRAAQDKAQPAAVRCAPCVPGLAGAYRLA